MPWYNQGMSGERSFIRSGHASWPQLGLALGGGGAKGLAHIGVLAILEQAGIPVEIVAGTSAGAIVGALFSAGCSPHDIAAVMRQAKLSDWLPRDRSGRGLFGMEGIHRIIDRGLGGERRIESLPRRFAAVAVELDSGQETAFTHGSLADAACASASFPVFLSPAQVEGKRYLDGGLVNPVPFDVAWALGADRVLAVDLRADEPVFVANPARRRRGELLYRLVFTFEQQRMLQTGMRAIGIMTARARACKAAGKPADLTIYPNVERIGLIDFDLLDASIAAGEAAMREALPRLEKMLAPTPLERMRHTWASLLPGSGRPG